MFPCTTGLEPMTCFQFIAAADTSEVRQTLEAHDAKIVELLQELKETNKQILFEQAKSQQVEEQLESLTQTVRSNFLLGIAILKPSGINT